jgi:hypothetical protein
MGQPEARQSPAARCERGRLLRQRRSRPHTEDVAAGCGRAIMTVSRPYRRTCRPFLSGAYGPGSVTYIRHPKFAREPTQYIRAFEILQKDLLTLFEYIEPSDSNLKTYSYRIHELLIRVCIEIESNFKVILSDNSYTGKRNLDMQDYKKVNATHRLSSFAVRLPVWQGKRNIRKPYASWARRNSRHTSLPWYQAYNNSKHNRHINFKQANFGNLTDAILVLLRYFRPNSTTMIFLVLALLPA